MHSIEQALINYKTRVLEYLKLVAEIKKKYGVDVCPLDLGHADLERFTRNVITLTEMQKVLGLSQDEIAQFDAEVRAALHASAEKK